jgi:predicted ArsR family transcriptional regulator
MADRSGDRILFSLKTRGPQSIGDLGAAFDMTAEAARQQLARMREQGLVKTSDERQPKGRPKKLWRLTAAGHARYPDRHGQLTVDLIRSVRATFGEAGLAKLIAARESETLDAYQTAMAGAETLAGRVERLAEARSAEGYMAAWSEAEDGSLLLVENHCPIRAAAAACQNFCSAERDIFASVLGPDCTVERTEHILAGARRCAYRITPSS